MNLTCHLTNETIEVSPKEYKRKIEQYGNEQNLQNYYVLEKFALLLKKGTTLETLATSFGITLDPSKQYNQIVKFHKANNVLTNTTPNTVSFIKSSKNITKFINLFRKEIANNG